MNGKVIICVLALAGIGVCVFYFVFKSKSKKRDSQNEKDDYLSKTVRPATEKVNDDIEKAREKLAKEKRDVAMSMQKRHEDASKEMKQSLNKIIDDTLIDKTENTETLNDIMDDLDKLLD